MSNGTLYCSMESFRADLKEFYDNLNETNHAPYEDLTINVLSFSIAHLSTKFHWISTGINGQRIEMKGTWSALYVLMDGQWKMSFHYESFTHSKKNQIGDPLKLAGNFMPFSIHSLRIPVP